MAKKKKAKKRQAAKQKLAGMSGDQLIKKGDAWIAGNNGREAIASYKQALKNGSDPAIVDPKLFGAYWLRYGELLAKKMVKEAGMVQDMAGRIFARISRVDSGILKIAAEFLPVSAVVDIYIRYLAQTGTEAEVEKILGSRMVTENCLGLAQRFGPNSRLAQDAPIVACAKEEMDAGRWARAFKQMRPVAKASPFADIKSFAKAMTAFQRGDRASAENALAGLDRAFPLKSARSLLTDWALGKPVDPQGNCPATARLLMGESIHKHSYCSDLETAVQKGDVRSIVKRTKALAGLLSIGSRETRIAGIVEIIGWSLGDDAGMESRVFLKLLDRIIPSPGMRKRIVLKIMSLKNGFLSLFTPDFILETRKAVACEKDGQMAVSHILVRMCRIFEKEAPDFWEHGEALEEIFDFLRLPLEAVEEENGPAVIFYLAQRAFEEDPENRDACDLLLGLSADSPAMRKALVSCLEEMGRIHDRDPRPCLMLSRLFYAKGAYRKAEKALAQAYDRAPHDLKVRREYALSYLFAASGNLKRGKLDLADQDLVKAEHFNIPEIAPFIAEKKLVSQTLRAKKFSKEGFEKLTRGRAIHEKIKVMLLFRKDTQDPGFRVPVKSRGMDGVLNGLKKQLGEPDPVQARDLLTPLKGTTARLYAASFFAGPLMKSRGQILDRLDDKDFLSLILDLAGHGFQRQVVRQLNQRRRQKDNIHHPIFDFYYEAFAYMSEQAGAGRRLELMIEQADDRLTAHYKRIAGVLAPLAPGHLQPDFYHLDFDEDWDLDEEDDGWDEDNWDEDDLDENTRKVFTDVVDKVIGRMVDNGSMDIAPVVFDPEPVFGKGRRCQAVGAAAGLLATAAQRLVLGDREAADFFEASFDDFMRLVGRAVSGSSSDFRRVGRKFAQEFGPAKEIVQAIEICGITVTSADEQHFVMGMRTGI